MSFIRTSKNQPHNQIFLKLETRENIEIAIVQAHKLLAQLGRIDLAGFEAMPHDVAVMHIIQGPVPNLLYLVHDGISLLHRLLSPSVNRDDEPTWDDKKHFVVLCKSSIATLKEAELHLQQACIKPLKWTLIEHLEQTRHQTQQMLRTCLIEAARIRLPAAHNIFPYDASELQHMLRLRSVLFMFREHILEITAHAALLPDTDVGLHMREARIEMLQLFADKSYQHMRTADREALQSVCQKINHWLDHSWHDFAYARSILIALHDVTQRLSAILQHPLLVQYDKDLCMQLIAQLQYLADHMPAATKQASHDYINILEKAVDLAYRSKEIESMIQASTTLGVVTDADALLVSIKQMQHVLQAL